MAEHFNPFSPRMKPRHTKDDYKKAPEPMGDAMSPRVTPFEYRFYERTEEYSHPNVVNTPEGPPPEPPEAWRRRHHNWRLAAQLLADGVAYWDVANRIGCRHNHFLRAMRESARFNRYIVEETQLRREAQERRLEMLGERLPHWIRNLEDNPRLVAMVFKRLMGTRPGELTKARR